ncbi:MAG: RNA polymerase-binding protein DksA [Rickettsiales bacterium]|nr:RNA polymerase-binding protein DksA [Rickettsiales bacterium]
MIDSTITKTSGVSINNEIDSNLSHITIKENYSPISSDSYMCDESLKYFQVKLIAWKGLLLIELDNTMIDLKNKHMQEPDENDRASAESDTSFELRTRERYMKLITKIDQALARIENKEYGYCIVTGEEIGLKRLEARPIATMSIEAQEEYEQKKKLMKTVEEEEAF